MDSLISQALLVEVESVERFIRRSCRNLVDCSRNPLCRKLFRLHGIYILVATEPVTSAPCDFVCGQTLLQIRSVDIESRSTAAHPHGLEFLIPFLRWSSRTDSYPVSTEGRLLLPVSPCGLSLKPFDLNLLSLPLEIPVRRSSSARLIFSMENPVPCSDLISSMACATIRNRSLLDVSFIIPS